jgi:signal transduction histidine kinase
MEVFVSASHYVTIALENAKLYEEVKALDKVKKKVIHHLSHELKTPLVIVQGAFRLIRKRLTGSELVKIEKSLSRGARNLERLSDLQVKIDDILKNMKAPPENQDTYRRESLMDLIEEVEEKPGVNSLEKLKEHILTIDGDNDIHEEFFNAGSILSDICEEARAAAERRGLCLMRQFDNDACVYTDKVVFRKVCNGLLRNAIENTPDEGCIEISAKSNHDGVVIKFRDHGVGITKDNQKQIFSGFFPTQPTEAYMSKKPYAFNAGGAGVDLLRIKTFADKLNFHVNFVSQRCPVLLTTGNTCAGKVSACQYTVEPSECFDQGGSVFEIRFSPVAERSHY